MHDPSRVEAVLLPRDAAFVRGEADDIAVEGFAPDIALPAGVWAGGAAAGLDVVVGSREPNKIWPNLTVLIIETADAGFPGIGTHNPR